jgi:large subunit ribosomal protein L18
MDKLKKRIRRKIKIRSIISGTAATPRVSIFRSNRFIYAQAIDDQSGQTIAASSSLKSTSKLAEQASEVGKKLAEDLKSKKVDNIVFDRNGYKYHGNVKIVADTLRENKIKF